MTRLDADTLLSEWIRRSGNELTAYLLGRTECREAAADLAQETYLRLHLNPQITSIQYLHRLAYRIAGHLLIDERRRRAVRARYQPAGEYTQPSPDEYVLASQRFRMLNRALRELPAGCATAYHLHMREGLSYSEIASRLGISKAMVAKHLTRAILHCHKRLGD